MCAKLNLVYSDDHNLERFLDYTRLIPKCFPTLKSLRPSFSGRVKRQFVINIKTANASFSKGTKLARHYI